MSTAMTDQAPHAPPATPPTPRDSTANLDKGFRAAASSAGIGILLLAALATFGVLFAVDGLVTPGDASRTARHIGGSEMLFKLGIVSLLVTAAVDVVVACALYRVFRRTSSDVSLLAAVFRLAYATVFVVAVSHLVGALRLLHEPSGAFSALQNQARALSEVQAFHDDFSAGLALFGAHLLLVGYLAYGSRFVPRLLAALVCLAGAGYLFDSLARVLSNGSLPEAATVTFVGEFLLGVWLLAKGRRLTEG